MSVKVLINSLLIDFYWISQGELRGTMYHHRDREHAVVGDDSSDYFEYEHEQTSMMGIRPHYTFNNSRNFSGQHPEQFGPDDRYLPKYVYFLTN